jgi:hypothetical protein
MKNTPLNPLQPGPRPMLPGIPNPTCPTLLEVRSVLEKTRDLQRAIRKLRRSTQRCPTCPERAECPTMRSFAQAMDSAIREVCQEWGLIEE